ncbi:hypothetical protein AB0C12_33340 [Actinoplanes sp. NPDC048967]
MESTSWGVQTDADDLVWAGVTVEPDAARPRLPQFQLLPSPPPGRC